MMKKRLMVAVAIGDIPIPPASTPATFPEGWDDEPCYVCGAPIDPGESCKTGRIYTGRPGIQIGYWHNECDQYDYYGAVR